MKQDFLKVGDVVDIVAPGWRCKKRDLQLAVKKLKSWGLVPRVPPNIFGRDVLCAQSDRMRFQQLYRALGSQDSKMIWCVRGGYGSIRVLDFLRLAKRPAQAKWLLGYSDITTIHSFLNRKWGWSSLHGPLLETLGKGSVSVKDEKMVRDILFGQKVDHEFRLKPINGKARKMSRLTGKIVGGNLTVLCSTIGLPWIYDAKGKIVFFEDLGERGYRVDRMLKHLEQVGFFRQVRAVVFGDFTGGYEANGKSMCARIIDRFAREVSFPVYKGLPAGHGKNQATLPIGTQAKIHRVGQGARLHVSYRP